jgi:adenylate kinase
MVEQGGQAASGSARQRQAGPDKAPRTARNMRVLLIGAPGAGKGTQAIEIAKHFGLTHISSGELLRRHMAEGTAIGRQVREYVERGDLVPDAIMMDMLFKPVRAASESTGYVLDGFPRTLEQAEAAYRAVGDQGMGVQVAVYLYVPDEELVKRLLTRSRGGDDTRAVIEHRLEVYREKTLPMLDYYAQREKLIQINGARPQTEVTWSIVVQLQRVKLT